MGLEDTVSGSMNVYDYQCLQGSPLVPKRRIYRQNKRSPDILEVLSAALILGVVLTCTAFTQYFNYKRQNQIEYIQRYMEGVPPVQSSYEHHKQILHD